LVLATGSSLFLFHQAILLRIGNYLVAADPLRKADAVAVLAGGEMSRCKTAADLYSQGWVPLILITKNSYPVEHEDSVRYGIPAWESHEKCLAVLGFYKVPQSVVEILDGYNESTADEAQKVRLFLQSHRMQHLLVVTSNFHTRRTGLMFRRMFRNTGIRVLVQATPPDAFFDPQEWWTRRRDAKTLLWEYQKLFFYAFRY
jgi:uncharacterized SAM-binding protein YcdF (DUF218 family)